jgi:Secretion system C-terminal sorting domain
MMKVTLRISGLLFGLVLWSITAWAQPANDDCANAFEMIFGASEATAVKVNGDSRGATASTTPTSVCSGSWYTDDTWYKFRTPVDLPANGIIVRAFFNNATTPTDVPAVGMAIYASCDAGETPLRCFSSDVPEDNTLELPGACILADHEYFVRIWSTGADATTEGTFRVAAFENAAADASLWWETFAGGIEANGWTTEGTCAVTDSNINAGWKYLPLGLLDKGAYIFAGAGISSPTLCDGAVGVDSDFDDNGGVEGAFGSGPCPAPAQHFLISPEINTSEWTAVGLSLSWNQAIRQFQSTFFFSYRTKDGAADWSDWVDFAINDEFEVNGNFDNTNVQRHFMPGAAGHDLLQVRFVYNANYYMWGIDDVKIVETEAFNGRVQSNFYAIAPWATIPENQVYPFGALADVYNAGASELTNVVLNHTVMNTETMEVLYDEDLAYGTIGPDFLAENRLNPTLIELPPVAANYSGTYTLTEDQVDFDTTDNTITFNYGVGGNTFGLEDGFTRSVAVANGIYDANAPLSYAYGNYFRPVEDVKVERIIWGVNNPDAMVDKTVQIYLLQWTDTNGDRIAENNERRFIGFADYTFSGTEGDNAIIETTLENFDNPGEDIIMQGGFGYIAIVEYQASVAADPQFFMLASEARNFGAQVLAMDTAVAQGLADMRVYSSVLGFSPDGNIANIDYEVTELDVNDTRIFFGHDIVPLVRIVVEGVNTVDQLPLDNLISAYPNPAVDQVQVKLEFTKPYSDVKLRLVDNLGRVVYYKSLTQTISDHIESVSVKDLSTGNYMLQVETPDGQRSIPVVVVK